MIKFIAFLLTFLFSGTLQAQSLDCIGALAPRTWLKLNRELLDTQRGLAVPTVGIGEPTMIQKMAGAAHVLTRKTGLPWYSNFNSSGVDPQGDPRAPLILLGREIAAVLGYSMPTADQIILPTTERLNAGIARLNRHLPNAEKIVYQFYDQGRNTSKSYLERLAEGELPVSATDPAICIHDHAFHVPALLATQGESLRISLLLKNVLLPALNASNRHGEAPNPRERVFLDEEFDAAVAFPTLILGQLRSARQNEFGPLREDLSEVTPLSAYFHGAQSISETYNSLRDWPALDVQQRQLHALDKTLEDLPGAAAHNFREVIQNYLNRRRTLRRAAKAVLQESQRP